MSKKLLLADDSITIQKVIGITFANEDYALEIVDNGDDALQKAQAERPDLVLADVYMPGKNGYELCEAIKADPAMAGVPVLLLTGTFEPFDEGRARDAGADDWIAKPFESQALIDKVEDLLEKGATAAAPQPAAAAQPAPAEPEPEPEVAAVDDSDDWGSLLETSDEEDFDEPQTWAAQEQDEQGLSLDEEGGFDEEIESSGQDEDLWGSLSLEEESLEEEPLEDESEQEQPVGEDLWGSLNDELTSAEAQDQEPEAEPAPEVPEQLQQDEEDVLALEEDDILEAEDLPEDEEQESVSLDESVEDFGALGESGQDEAQESFAPAQDEGLSMQSEEGFFLGEQDEEPSSEQSLISPAEALSEAQDEFAQFQDEALEPGEDQPAAASTPEAVEKQVQALSDEDLGRIVEQVASRVLEKIAWEVVPDLAESIIREEIRKIREGGD